MKEADTVEANSDGQQVDEKAGEGALSRGEGGRGVPHAGQFDSMLEMLPEDIGGAPFGLWANGGESGEETAGGLAGAYHERSDMGFSFGAGDEGMAGVAAGGEATQPIDIVPAAGRNNYLNLQNGEIDQLWHFNVDEFMMTPSEQSGMSDGATISQPNSFTSEAALGLPGSQQLSNDVHEGVPFLSDTRQMQRGGSAGVGQGDKVWDGVFISGQVLRPAYEHDVGIFSPAVFTNGARALDGRVAMQDTPQAHDCGPGDLNAVSRPLAAPKRPSGHLKTNSIAEDGHIPLSSHTTTNAIKKTQLTRQPSSSSLSSYRKGPQNNASSGDGCTKPQTQCFNCKTFKTPLWRRDLQGNTLCNACGLFQKLHGTMRPLSLKSDVIKKRNTKKRARKAEQDAQKAANSVIPRKVSGSLPRGSTDHPIAPGLENGRSHVNEMQAMKYPSRRTYGSPTKGGTAQSGTVGMDFNSSRHYRKSSQDVPFFPVSETYRLNSSDLMKHNSRMASTSQNGTRKSRQGSSSSSTSSKSSSRQVVPILPKPSSVDVNMPHQPLSSSMSLSNLQTYNSAMNSTASSPRYMNSPRGSNGAIFSATSPIQSNGILSTSAGCGSATITIPRKNSSRGMSQSLSFMAQSLQQLQNQNSNNLSSSAQPAVSASNGAGSLSPQHHTSKSPSSPDLFSHQSSRDATSTESHKSHTSLLSQQLQQNHSRAAQNTVQSQFQTPDTPAVTSSHKSMLVSTAAAPALSFQAVNATVSPRHSYAVSMQQQRGVLTYDQQIKRSSSLSPMNSDTANPARHQKSASGTRIKESVMEDLDWLKFSI
ncbi:AaceriAFR237Wp [[Ashbya] aceris (nom. inval.)]|nr:AaceriAFR237Wp [[Ashbya] aceris (nom. inval.)]